MTAFIVIFVVVVLITVLNRAQQGNRRNTTAAARRAAIERQAEMRRMMQAARQAQNPGTPGQYGPPAQQGYGPGAPAPIMPAPGQRVDPRLAQEQLKERLRADLRARLGDSSTDPRIRRLLDGAAGAAAATGAGGLVRASGPAPQRPSPQPMPAQPSARSAPVAPAPPRQPAAVVAPPGSPGTDDRNDGDFARDTTGSAALGSSLFDFDSLGETLPPATWAATRVYDS